MIKLLILIFLLSMTMVIVADDPVVRRIDARIETVTFYSKVLDKTKTFSVVLPDNYDHEKKDWPVLFLFHGRGRHERSLIDDSKARTFLMKAPFVVILPDGDDGWYIDSPVRQSDKYQTYTEEVISTAESLYNLSVNPAQRGLTGWSMGGYGCVRFAETHAGDFSLVAPIIGLLDFPRIGLPAGQSYDVPLNRFGKDPAVWLQLNPITDIEKLKDMSIMIITADKAFDRTMNENFTARLTKEKIPYKFKILKGAHTLSVVRCSIPLVIDFMIEHLDAESSGL